MVQPDGTHRQLFLACLQAPRETERLQSNQSWALTCRWNPKTWLSLKAFQYEKTVQTWRAFLARDLVQTRITCKEH